MNLTVVLCTLMVCLTVGYICHQYAKAPLKLKREENKRKREEQLINDFYLIYKESQKDNAPLEKRTEKLKEKQEEYKNEAQEFMQALSQPAKQKTE